jgi:DNA-binding beta-propeller fold protein YncE
MGNARVLLVKVISRARIYFQGITLGTGPTTYSPAASVTRDQMVAFLSGTQNSVLNRGSRRAAHNQFWTTVPQYAGLLGTTTVGFFPELVASDGADLWVANEDSETVSRVCASDGKLLGTWTGTFAAWGVLAAIDGQRILVTNSGDNSVSLFRAADFAPLGTVSTGAGSLPFGACSDGLHFWITLGGANKLARF